MILGGKGCDSLFMDAHFNQHGYAVIPNGRENIAV
jgi:hypothetical protein